MPYKFIVAVDSKPFKGAPQVILEGLNRLTWAGKHTVCEPNFLQFNELLALGYFEEQSIGVSFSHAFDIFCSWLTFLSIMTMAKWTWALLSPRFHLEERRRCMFA